MNALTTTNIKITSRHATLSEAVKAAGINLSYNPEAAAAQIKDLECGFRGAKAGEAYVTPEGVFYALQCDIKLLNKFSPFCSVMDDGPFRVVLVRDGLIEISETAIPANSQNRKNIAALGLMVTKRA